MSYKSVKDVVTMFQENGFVLKSQKGSHMKFEKNGNTVSFLIMEAKAWRKALITTFLGKRG